MRIWDVPPRELCDQHLLGEHAKAEVVSSVCSPMKPYGLEKRSDEVIELYESGLSTSEVADEMGVWSESVRKLLKRHGVERRPPSSHRRHTLNEGVFEEIDTPEKAWALGFISADAQLSYHNGGYYIDLPLGRQDRNALEKIKRILNATYPIKSIKNGQAWQLIIGSKRMFESLDEHGVRPEKNTRMAFSPHVPEDFWTDYIRGYFDGDGWVSTRRQPNANADLGFLGPIEFIERVTEIVESKTGVEPPSLVMPSSHDEDSNKRQVLYSSLRSFILITSWMYGRWHPSLDRKREKVKEMRHYLKNRNEANCINYSGLFE